MIIKNPWVGYLNRSYASIKASVLARLKISAPEISDYSESNILVVIVGIFAGIGEMLNYYIDSMAREGFLETAKKLASVTKIVKLINYRIRSSISATVDITFSTADEVQVAAGETITIPAGTQVTDSSGKPFLTTRAGYIKEGLYSTLIPTRQQSIVSLATIATSSGATSQVFALPTSYDDGTLYVEIAGVPWTLKNHFGFSSPTATHYTVEVSTDSIPYLQFGDGVNGAIPTAGATIAISYRTTYGTKGNLVEATITTLVSSITIPTQSPTITAIEVTNVFGSSGGLDVEGIERIRKSAPLSLRTLDRAVTRQDYVDITKLAPAVDKAAVSFACGKIVTLYVAPVGGGIASTQMLADTKDYVEARSIIGLNIETKAAGETYIRVQLTVTAKFRVNVNLVTADVQKALLNAYSADNSDINKPIRTSDIIALVDNLEKVDYMDLVEIYAIPYARPIGHARELSWIRTPLEGHTQSTPLYWKIIWDGVNFRLFKKDTQIAVLTLNVTYTYLNILSVKILSTPAGIQNGDRWEFKTYQINKDIPLDDFTVPRIHPQLTYVDITVNEQAF